MLQLAFDKTKVIRPRKKQRQASILSHLEENPALRVSQLAEFLFVSTETVRRDLAELEEMGRINRTYGGAIRNNYFEPALNERMKLHIAERQKIARMAFAHCDISGPLLLGGGATMIQFARKLRDVRHRLTIVTPVYSVALELIANPLIEILLLPGVFDPQEGMVYGPMTLRAIESYRVPLALIGASGLNSEGVSEAMLGAGDVYSAMLRSAAHSVILADHSKFEKRALVLLQSWKANLTLITDRRPVDPLYAAIALGGANLILTDDALT